MFSYTLRITPQPHNQQFSYSVDCIAQGFLKKYEPPNRIMIFQESEPVHLHIYLETHVKVSAIRKWIKKQFPLLKGNPFWAIHPCSNCKQKKHKKDMFKSCSPQAKTYVAKEGNLVVSQCIPTDLLCQYVASGKELAITASLTTDNSRRLQYIGSLFQSDPKNLHGHILKWYETQNQVPPRGNIMKTLVHKILFQYSPEYRSIYKDSLEDLCTTIESDRIF